MDASKEHVEDCGENKSGIQNNGPGIHMGKKAQFASKAITRPSAMLVQFDEKIKSAVAQPTRSYAKVVRKTCSNNKDIILKQVI